MAPLAWVLWVPGNPSIFRQWVPEPINFGRKKTGNHLADYKKKLPVRVIASYFFRVVNVLKVKELMVQMKGNCPLLCIM